MQHLKLLLVLFIVSLSACRNPGNVEAPPLGDFCDLRKDTTVDPASFYFRCVTPDERLYSLEMDQALNYGFEGTKSSFAGALRSYVVRLQGELSSCRSQNEDTK